MLITKIICVHLFCLFLPEIVPDLAPAPLRLSLARCHQHGAAKTDVTFNYIDGSKCRISHHKPGRFLWVCLFSIIDKNQVRFKQLCYKLE